jgi:hypothetical protein
MQYNHVCVAFTAGTDDDMRTTCSTSAATAPQQQQHLSRRSNNGVRMYSHDPACGK